MSIHSLKNIKIDARQLQQDLLPIAGKVSYQSCLQMLAKQYGYKNWQQASSYAKENNITIFNAPITNSGAFTHE